MGVQQNWSTTASSNSGADSLVNVAENQAPSTINDAMRAIMAQVKKTVADMSGGLVTTGSSTAYAVTSNEVITSLVDGMKIVARAHTANGASPTFALDDTAAKAIKAYGTTAPYVGQMVAGGVYTFTYYASSDVWLLSGGPPSVGRFVGETFEWNSNDAPPLSLFCYGQAVSRTTYAALFAVIGTTFGVGDGSTTFNIPDDRGRVTAGQDDMGGTSANRLTNISGSLDGDVLGTAGGSESATLTQANLPNCTFPDTLGVGGTLTTNNTVYGAESLASATSPGDTANFVRSATGASASFNISGLTVTGDVTSGGSGTAVAIVQPTIIRNKCIFAGV